MIKNFCNWLDNRTGYRKLIDALLLEHIPGGPKWRYVWGSTLVFVFAVQLITGILLMTAYSPGASTAWGSVYYIQYEMDFGWLIRGLHHFGSGTMVVLLGIHMLQVVIAGAHLPPREINWWLGLLLLALVMGMSLTGYLLPWDQKGYWATQVATNIAATMPIIGPWLQKIIVGGAEYGHHTLTRFFALHVGILPLLIIGVIVAHVAVFRRHGVTTPKNARGEGWFWPEQAFRDMVVSMIIFGILLTLVFFGHGHTVERSTTDVSLWERWAHAGKDGLGANLDAPADPGTASYPARPEWYFLFLFQLLKYFEGPMEIIGTVVIPGAVGAVLFILPLLGYGRMRTFGHVVGVLAIVGLLAGIGYLTWQALDQDNKPVLSEEQIEALADGRDAELTLEQRDAIDELGHEPFQVQLKKAERLAARAIELAAKGLPPDGPGNLLRHDHMTAGRELFAQNCAGCHSYKGQFDESEFKAADLAGFGTETWIRNLLKNPGDPHYFGRTKLTAMTEWVKEAREDLSADELRKLEGDFDRIAKWLAGRPTEFPEDETSEYAKGFQAFETHCLECHPFAGDGGSNLKGPDFTGYGNADWLRLMIMSPDHPARYGWRNRNTMPLFRDLEGPSSSVTKQELARVKAMLLDQIDLDDEQADEKQAEVEAAMQAQHLSDQDRELIIRWLLERKPAAKPGQ